MGVSNHVPPESPVSLHDADSIDAVNLSDLRSQLLQFFHLDQLRVKVSAWLSRVRDLAPAGTSEVIGFVGYVCEKTWGHLLSCPPAELAIVAVWCVAAMAFVWSVALMAPLLYVLSKVVLLVCIGVALSKLIGKVVDGALNYIGLVLPSTDVDIE